MAAELDETVEAVEAFGTRPVGWVRTVPADALVLRCARTAQIVGVVMGGRKPPAAMASRSRYPPPAPIQSAAAPTAHRRRRTGPVSRLPCRTPRSNFLACCSSCDLHRSPQAGSKPGAKPVCALRTIVTGAPPERRAGFHRHGSTFKASTSESSVSVILICVLSRIPECPTAYAWVSECTPNYGDTGAANGEIR